MFPFHDENATQRPAIVTIAFIALNVFAWVLVQGAGAEHPLADVGLQSRPDSRRAHRRRCRRGAASRWAKGSSA